MQTPMPLIVSSRGPVSDDAARIMQDVELREVGRGHARLSSGRGNKAWLARAKRVVAARYKQAVTELGMDARKIRSFVTRGYPDYAGTDKRHKYPYRAWIQALNARMEQHRLREEQLTLFAVEDF
jgi:hypothetical protein